MQATPQKEKKNWLYQLIVWLYRIIFYAFLGGRLIGRPIDIPQGAFVVMSNHINLLDCVSMALFVKGRELRFMAKAELFKVKLIGNIVRFLHAFPVQRGQTDLGAMRASMQVLRSGEVLGIFPEGTRGRDGKMLPLQTGAAVLALKCDAPIIPIYIAGRYRLWGRLRVAIGRPIAMDDLRGRGADKESVDQFLHRMEAAFLSLSVRAADKI